MEAHGVLIDPKPNRREAPRESSSGGSGRRNPSRERKRLGFGSNINKLPEAVAQANRDNTLADMSGLKRRKLQRRVHPKVSAGGRKVMDAGAEVATTTVDVTRNALIIAGVAGTIALSSPKVDSDVASTIANIPRVVQGIGESMVSNKSLSDLVVPRVKLSVDSVSPLATDVQSSNDSPSVSSPVQDQPQVIVEAPKPPLKDILPTTVDMVPVPPPFAPLPPETFTLPPLEQGNFSQETMVRTQKLLSVVAPDLRAAAAKRIPYLLEALRERNIDSKNVVAYMMATAEYESKFDLGGEYMGEAQAEKFGYDGGGAFAGAADVHLTGKRNFAAIGKVIGVDLENNPKLARDPIIAAKISAAVFTEFGTAKYAQDGDFVGARRTINPGEFSSSDPRFASNPYNIAERSKLYVAVQ